MPPKIKKAYAPPASLSAFRATTEKKWGGKLVRKDEIPELEFISSGVSGLDVALGGGWALGRYHQVLGQPNTCKTSLTVIAIANALKQYPDRGVAYIDVERTITSERFESHGVDPEDKRLFWLKPQSAEEVSDMLRDQLRTGLFSFLAIDSVGAMAREEELYEKDAADEYVGRAAKLLTRMAKQIAAMAENSNTAVLQINQYRKDFASGLDVGSGPTIMGYMTTSSVTTRRLGGAENVLKVKDGDGDEIEVAHKVAVKVDRSKLVPFGKTAQFWYHKTNSEYGTVGIDVVKETYDIAIKCGALYKEKETSSWWFFPDGSKENGEKGVLARLRDDEKALAEVRAACVAKAAEEPTVEPTVTFRRGD
jgi:RecA/RadA recombinase